MKVGYIRVSTVDQNDARQIEKMKDYKVEKIYKEKVSGKNLQDRKELQAMLDFVREGDTVYIHDFSRLARSTKDLLDIIDKLKKKKVDLVSFKENIDTNTPTGKLMLTMIGAINEFERENLLERQKEGILIAKELGKYKGRKPIAFPGNWEEIYPLWEKREITGVQAKKMLGLKHSTFYKLIKDWKGVRN
jgi:DNA invertase Pin-like site-specific DNA recombinase